MKKKVLIVLFSVFVAGIYAQAQKINVVSVSKERDIHNFYTMMKEAFPLAYNDPAAPRFIFFDDNKNFIFGVGGYVQLSGVYDFNGVEDYNFFFNFDYCHERTSTRCQLRYDSRTIPFVF